MLVVDKQAGLSFTVCKEIVEQIKRYVKETLGEWAKPA